MQETDWTLNRINSRKKSMPGHTVIKILKTKGLPALPQSRKQKEKMTLLPTGKCQSKDQGFLF